MPLFLEVPPNGRGKGVQNAAEQSAAVIAFWGTVTEGHIVSNMQQSVHLVI
jgi:hypothetical protein